jgi:predicted transcriptional regulator
MPKHHGAIEAVARKVVKQIADNTLPNVSQAMREQGYSSNSVAKNVGKITANERFKKVLEDSGITDKFMDTRIKGFMRSKNELVGIRAWENISKIKGYNEVELDTGEEVESFTMVLRKKK